MKRHLDIAIRAIAVGILALSSAAIGGLIAPRTAFAAEITVYKDPNCGCCTKWADHLSAAGHKVIIKPTRMMSLIKKNQGVPDELASCHTAIVEGYVIEGHVPVADIERLLAERPKAKGLSVPGMPIGSPGMEVESEPAENYDVVLFGADGGPQTYASY